MLSGESGWHGYLATFRAANLVHENTPVGRFLVCSIFRGVNSSLPKRGALNQIAASRLNRKLWVGNGESNGFPGGFFTRCDLIAEKRKKETLGYS